MFLLPANENNPMENILPETTIDYQKNGNQKCRHLTGIHQGIGPREIKRTNINSQAADAQGVHSPCYLLSALATQTIKTRYASLPHGTHRELIALLANILRMLKDNGVKTSPLYDDT